MPGPRVAVAPAGVRGWLADAVRDGGGEVVGVADAEALVWAETNKPDELVEVLQGEGSGVRWVQLPYAGIEPYVRVLDPSLVWTCAKGVYAEPVAEHALALLLGGLRNVGPYARASSWSAPAGTNLLGAKVVVLGGGGITESLLRLLGPFGADVTVVRRSAAPMTGAAHVVDTNALDDALEGALGVVLALALTSETHGIIARPQLERMHERGWLVNVARGGHVVTDDLVAVLREERIGGAALDVTDPEPLPDGHPLWSEPRCIITPHVGNTPEMAVPLLAQRITENVRRWAASEPLLGLVDPAAGVLAVLDAGTIVGLLAEPHRRRVFAAMVFGTSNVHDLREVTGLDTKVVVTALNRFVEAEAVVASGDGAYFIVEEAFTHAARAAAPPPPDDGDVPSTLRAFVRDGRIMSIPAQHGKRLVLLDMLSQQFEPGRRYTEAQVNLILQRWHDDHAALRRYLVDDGFLDRDAGEYWRTGGTFIPDT